MISYDELMELIKSRRSVRRYLDKPVAPDDIGKIIEAATWAPSASNRQDWQFAVLTSRERIANLAEKVADRWRILLEGMESEIVREEMGRYARNFEWFSDAPALIVVSCKRPEGFLSALLRDEAWVVAGAYASAAMAAQNILIAAHSLGIATCCLTGPVAASDEIKNQLGLERNRRIVCLVALGYSAAPVEIIHRKQVSEVIRVIE